MVLMKSQKGSEINFSAAHKSYKVSVLPSHSLRTTEMSHMIVGKWPFVTAPDKMYLYQTLVRNIRHTFCNNCLRAWMRMVEVTARCLPLPRASINISRPQLATSVQRLGQRKWSSVHTV